MLKLNSQRIRGTIWDECEKSEIVQILVSHEDLTINSIQFVYLSNGEITHSAIHGQPTGLNFDMVTFDYPSEFLSGVSGEIGSNGLVSIAFKSNKRKFGPFGRKDIGDNPSEFSERLYKRFSYNFGRKSSFGGFHGYNFCGCVIAIGVYVKPIMSPEELNNEK